MEVGPTPTPDNKGWHHELQENSESNETEGPCKTDLTRRSVFGQSSRVAGKEFVELISYGSPFCHLTRETIR